MKGCGERLRYALRSPMLMVRWALSIWSSSIPPVGSFAYFHFLCLCHRSAVQWPVSSANFCCGQVCGFLICRLSLQKGGDGPRSTITAYSTCFASSKGDFPTLLSMPTPCWRDKKVKPGRVSAGADSSDHFKAEYTRSQTF